MTRNDEAEALRLKRQAIFDAEAHARINRDDLGDMISVVESVVVEFDRFRTRHQSLPLFRRAIRGWIGLVEERKTQYARRIAHGL